MTDKYIYNNAGTLTEKTATVTSAGGANAGQVVALDSGGHLDSTVMPTGVGLDTVSIVASEALSAGNLVNIYNNAGTPNCRKADASAANAGKIAHGFVLAAVSSGANATIYLGGQNTQLSALTAGDVFLSTAGGVSVTAPSTSGYTVQRVGVAISATAVDFTRGHPLVLA